MKENNTIERARKKLGPAPNKPRGDLKVYARSLAIITEKIKQSIERSR